jgi:hypothetical protein
MGTCNLQIRRIPWEQHDYATPKSSNESVNRLILLQVVAELSGLDMKLAGNIIKQGRLKSLARSQVISLLRDFVRILAALASV